MLQGDCRPRCSPNVGAPECYFRRHQPRLLSCGQKVLRSEGLKAVELQTISGRNIGDLSFAEIRNVKSIASDAGVAVACISHKNLFGSLSVKTTKIADPQYQFEMDTLRRLIEYATETGTALIPES